MPGAVRSRTVAAACLATNVPCPAAHSLKSRVACARAATTPHQAEVAHRLPSHRRSCTTISGNNAASGSRPAGIASANAPSPRRVSISATLQHSCHSTRTRPFRHPSEAKRAPRQRRAVSQNSVARPTTANDLSFFVATVDPTSRAALLAGGSFAASISARRRIHTTLTLCCKSTRAPSPPRPTARAARLTTRKARRASRNAPKRRGPAAKVRLTHASHATTTPRCAFSRSAID